MKIIKDLRILNAIGRKYNIVFDKEYKYILSNPYTYSDHLQYKGKQYNVKYFSGCFSPYITEAD